MPSKKNQSSVGLMIQRCHKWRVRRKQLTDQARATNDEIERERLLQAAEHYGRIVNEEQSKIDSTRDPKDKTAVDTVVTDTGDSSDTTDTGDEEENPFPEFLTNLN